VNRPAALRYGAAKMHAGYFWCPPPGARIIRLLMAMAVLITANACSNGSPVDTAAAVVRAEGGDGADVRRRASGISTAARLKAARLQREGASAAAAAARNVAMTNARAIYAAAIAQCNAERGHGRDTCRRHAADDYAQAKATADAVKAVNDPTA
jgi:hypothetical protein